MDFMYKKKLNKRISFVKMFVLKKITRKSEVKNKG